MTASAVLAVALEARRLLETLPTDQREEALLLVLDDEPLAPEDITRAQLEEVAPEVAVTLRRTALPLDELAPQPEGARAEQPARSGRPAHMDAREEGAARLVELVQLVANAGGKAEVGWLAEKLGVSEVATRKHIRRALQERYLIQLKRGVVELNPDPSAPVVVADRSGERAKKAVRRG